MDLFNQQSRVKLFRRGVSTLLALGLLLPGLGGTGCGGPQGAGTTASAPPDERPLHILLVTLDALRADHLGCYGYPEPTSPAMDSLAAEGALFNQAQVPRGQTWPALCSLLTGRYPLEHGVRENSNHPVEYMQMLPGYLRESGFRTAAFLANFSDAVDSTDRFGLDLMASPKDWFRNPQDKWDDDMTDQAVSWITENRHRPTFTWVHLMNPHRPYDPPAAERELLMDDQAYDGWLDDRVARSAIVRGIREGRIPLTEEQFDEFVHAPYWSPQEATDYIELMRRQDWHLTLDQLLDLIIVQKVDLSAADLAYIHSRYDAEIRAADRCVNRLLDTIDELGLHDRTLVIVSSDHGDELFDHNHYFFHSSSIYQSVLHVPLILRWPGQIQPATTVDSLVEITDLLPTVLDAAGIAQPAGLSGSSLLPLLGSEPVSAGSFAFAELVHHRPTDQRDGSPAIPPMDGVYSARDTRWKLVLNPSGLHPRKIPYPCLPGKSFPIAREELYDLERDPGERQNLLAVERSLLTDLALEAGGGEKLAAAEYLLQANQACGCLSAELNGWFKRHEGTPDREQANRASKEVRERLIALGYVEAEPLHSAPPVLTDKPAGRERLLQAALQLIRTAPDPGEEQARDLTRQAEAQLEELRSDSPPGASSSVQ